MEYRTGNIGRIFIVRVDHYEVLIALTVLNEAELIRSVEKRG